MLCEEGYGYIQIRNISDDKVEVIQIKKDFLLDFKSIFELDTETGSSHYDSDEVQEELNACFDFAPSFLVDIIIKPEIYKRETLSKEEYNRRFT